MAEPPPRDRSGRDEPEFDWLYGGDQGSRDGADRDADWAADRDADWAARRSAGRAQGQGRSPHDPEPTQRLPTLDRRPSDQPGRTAQGRGVDDPRIGGAGAPFEAPPRPGGAGRSGERPPGDRVRPVPPPPSARPSARPTTGGPRRRRPWLRWVKVVIALWVVFLVAVPLLAWSRIDKVDATPRGDRPAEQPGTTYLLVGSDSRAGLTRRQELQYGVGRAEGQRTDSILLLHTGAGPNLLLSIPRDSIVAIPGHGTTKINAAFAYGGPRLLAATIENDTGIRIDDYVEIGFAGFVNVVDAVGGITICPTQRMRDPLANLNIKKGCQPADGKTGLGYARSRHVSGLGDIARAQHQREVVSAVGKKAVSPWTVLNPVRYYRTAMAGASSLRVGTDTGLLSTLRFAWAMTRVNGKNGLTCGVPISDLAVHWDPDRSKRLFRLIAEDRTADIPHRLCRPSGLPGS